MFTVEPLETGKSELCRQVLRSLPAWFGSPETNENYARGVESLPMLVCKSDDGSIVGFLALKPHTPFAVEAYVLGVRPEWHRRGCGRLLFEAAEEKARSLGARFLTVKTLADSSPSENYKGTRMFYQALGFLPLEVFPTLWSPQHPCLLMLKPIADPHML